MEAELLSASAQVVLLKAGLSKDFAAFAGIQWMNYEVLPHLRRLKNRWEVFQFVFDSFNHDAQLSFD